MPFPDEAKIIMYLGYARDLIGSERTNHCDSPVAHSETESSRCGGCWACRKDQWLDEVNALTEGRPLTERQETATPSEGVDSPKDLR